MTDARQSEENLQAARLEAQKQWNANPCGSLPTEAFDKAYFDRVEAERYRQQYWQHGFFDYTSYRGKRVLEIGTGLGTDLKQFARNGARCHGVDITDRHLEMTRLNFESEGLKVELRKADATALPYTDATFDCVYSFGVLHHIPDVETVLAEFHRVLKPGGVLQTAVYHTWSIHTLGFFVSGILNGSLIRHGTASVLAQIETGADGIEIKPYVKLYSKRAWRQLVERAGFTTTRVEVRQVLFDGKRFLNALRPFERNIGWYVSGIFRKV